MAKTIQLTFYIYLTDQAQVTALQAQYPLGVSRGPLPAAEEFGAPYIAEGLPVTYPCTRTGWLPPGAAGKFPLDRAFFTINDGFWGHLFGRDQKYAWIGQFVFQPATDQVVDGEGGVGPPGPLREVAFAIGFEDTPVGSTNGAEGGQSPQSAALSRDASRFPDGLGLAIRADSIQSFTAWTKFGATPTSRGWERLYFRIRALPTSGDCTIWRMRWGGGNSGLAITINTSGALAIRNVSTSGAFFPTGSSGLMAQTAGGVEVGVWHCLDIVYNNGVHASAGNIQSADLWIDKVLAASSADFLHGEGAVTRTVDSSIAGVGIGSSGGAEVDLDDHIGFILPASALAINIGRNTYWTESIKPGLDWINGHHVARVDGHAFDATHSADWTGDVRGLRQVAGTAQAEDILTSSTSGALVAVNTFARFLAQQDRCLGWQYLAVSILNRRTSAGNGELGYTYTEASGGGGTTVMTAITQAGTNTWNTVAARPTGLTAPKALWDLMLRYTKAADANATQIQQLFGTLLLVGTFDQCDLTPDPEAEDPDAEPPTIPSPVRYGIHNAPYPRTPWVRSEVPPDSPAWVKSGTYTGNNLGQDVIAKIPAHFWWVRRTDANTGAVRWWSSMLGAKWAIAGDVRGGMNYATEDPEFVAAGGATDPESRSLLRIGGANAAENLSPATYQYVAVGDPGSRFLLNGAFRHDSGVTSFANRLADPDFLAEFMLAATEFPGGGGFFWLKGPGHAAPNGQQLASTDVATVGNFAAGELTSRASLHPSGVANCAYSLWRSRDGADYEGLELDEPVPFQIFSYVGDGAASRSMQLPRVSGRRPLWAIVQPTNGSAYVRDPTHATNTSSLATNGSTTITTGITGGGVDAITVGSTLNANGITHNVLVIMAADATAGNGGWGTNGESFYDPVPAPGGQWSDGYTQEELDELENPTVPEEVESFDDGPDLADDLADTVCVPFTLRAVNLAFARIGISDKVTAATDLLTPTSQERSLVVEFYETTLRYVLRDYPWAHATRYASLTLLEGSISDPVNADWVYSFRAPTGCLFVRRVIRPELGRKHDAKPPAFRMAVDDVGPLVYVTDDGVQFDSTDTPFIEIEYTVRPGCGARAGGDQKFVSTFAYRLAFELATALSRDEKTVLRMERGYILEKNTAATTVGNEQQQQPPGDPDWLLGR